MSPATAGQFWKTPFVFEFNGSMPATPSRLHFEAPDETWLRGALQQTITTSVSDSDRYLVETVGPNQVAEELLCLSESHMFRPEGTVFHMGVLPKFRGRGYALDLIVEATRICSSAGCWRIFCDTSSNNAPMLKAFRLAGYSELAPWQQPLI